MSHRIKFRPQGVILSSEIFECYIQADGATVDFKLISSGNAVLLSERYYPYMGWVILEDLSSLIESHMQSSKLAFCEYTLYAYLGTTLHDSVTLHVVYCDRFTPFPNTSTPIYLRENFLSTLQYRRVPTDGTVGLSFFAFEDEELSFPISAKWRTQDGNVNLYSSDWLTAYTHSGDGIVNVNIPLGVLRERIADANNLNATAVEVLGFTFNVGQRATTVLVDSSINQLDYFAFRNCFNCWDMALLPSVTTVKTEVERSTAVFGPRSSFYDRRINKTYEVETGPLTSDEAEWIDQLVSSTEVTRLVPAIEDEDEPYIFVPVLITDSTIEMPINGSQPNTAKFTWRFADNRPILRMTTSPNVFTTPYIIPFT